MPSRLLGTRWALTPPFHPYQALSPSATRLRALLSGRRKVFLPMATEAHCTGGLFSVALSVAEALQRARLLASSKRSAPWRYQARCPLVLGAVGQKTFVLQRRREDHGVRTFLPISHPAKEDPAITRPARRGKYTIPSDPSVACTARSVRQTARRKGQPDSGIELTTSQERSTDTKGFRCAEGARTKRGVRTVRITGECRRCRRHSRYRDSRC